MDDYGAASADRYWAAVADLERALAAQPGDIDTRRRLGHALYAAVTASMSLTRDQTLEITSARQAVLAEQVTQRILELNVDDGTLRRDAQALHERARDGRQWTWERQDLAIAAVVLVVTAGVAAAVYGGLAGNVIVVIAGAVLSSTLLAMIVLRYRRQNWRIRAERVAPLISRPGV